MAVFPVVLDSCVLYPMSIRDTLLRAAEAGLYRVHWCQNILEGATRNLVKDGRMTQEQAAHLEEQMNLAFPEAMIEVPELLLPCMDNHPGDRHVVAAALIAKAHVIVTDNLKHFPAASLEQFRLEAQSADLFLTHLYHLFPESMVQVLQAQVKGMKRNPMSLPELLELLRQQVPTFIEQIWSDQGSSPMLSDK